LEREKHCQKVWLDAQAKHPTLNRSGLAKLCPNEHHWLLKYCPDWYEQNSPPMTRQKRGINVKYYQDVWIKAQSEFPLLGRYALTLKFRFVVKQLRKHCPDGMIKTALPRAKIDIANLLIGMRGM